jgi:phenylalanyl-tRNA synthetase alpha subunit
LGPWHSHSKIQTSKFKLFDAQQKKLEKHNIHLKVENTIIEIKVQNPYMHFINRLHDAFTSKSI